MQQTFVPVRRFKKNTSGRDFVVGDLHGCFTRLRRELEASQFDRSRDRVFAVGDLVDRGFESPAVLDVVRRYDIQSVRGNHEDSIVRWRLCDAGEGFVRANGGGWLLDMTGDEEAIDAIVAYMAALPYAIEIETDFGLVGIVHANVPLRSWSRTVEALMQEGIDGKIRRKLIWDRSRWNLRQEKGFGSMRRVAARVLKGLKSGRGDACGWVEGVAAVIVGHTPSAEPKVSHNVINVDTGVVYGGNLTLLRLDEIPTMLGQGTRTAPVVSRISHYLPPRESGQL
ncbi:MULTISPECIES: metallophosphoesterase [Paraburkholderia]|jgi:serine/threonine protein phosphatase 1|uniref:metallophosphoesterase n=1 Tax=Paraburkholderia TaxID=1822464 RepID=UPI0038BA485B